MILIQPMIAVRFISRKGYTMFRIMLITLSLLFVSCGNYETVVGNDGVNQKIIRSMAKWINTKQKANGVYSYTIQQSLTDDKHMRNWLTTVYVENDRAVCRYFHQIDDFSLIIWLESLKLETLGKHPEGAPARIIDGLYNDCFHMASKDYTHSLIYTEDANGILESCYFPDDAYPSYLKIKISGFDFNKCVFEKDNPKKIGV